MPAMMAFYSAAFGVSFREVETRGVTSRFAELGGAVTLKFVPIRDAPDFSGFPVHQLGLEVQDVRRVVELAVRHGGRVQDPPARVDGRWQAAIRDPDGNTIELVESTGEPRDSLEQQQRLALVRLAAAVQDADYRGDLSRLRTLGDEIAPFAELPALARAARYWRGFAFWRRAINGANPPDADLRAVQKDFSIAVVEFEQALERDSTDLEARIAAAGGLMSLGFLNRGDTSLSLPLWRRAQRHLDAVIRRDPDNPRLLFITAGRVFWSPPAAGGDPGRAIAMVERGLQRLPRPVADADPLKPGWGEAELHMLIAFFFANKSAPDLRSAERHARIALAMRPEWHYVKNILLPQITGRRLSLFVGFGAFLADGARP
jgi:predicted enzyme related to lactoylglutathione lyase